MSYKATRKYLLGPDKFQKYMLSLIKKAVKHKHFILFVFLAIFVLICAGIAYNLISSKITSRYETRINSVDEEYLEFKSSSYFKEDSDAKENKKLKDKDQAKDTASSEASSKKETKTVADYAASYEKLFLSKPSTPQGALVGLKASKLYLDAGMYDKALQVVEKVIQKSKKSVFHQVEGYFLMLSILESKKDYDTAVTKLEELLKKAPESVQPTMMYNQARYYVKKNDPQKARSILTSIITKYPNSKDSAKAIALQSSLPPDSSAKEGSTTTTTTPSSSETSKSSDK